MSSLAKNTRATVIPCFRYRNAPAAIEWLCATFGFEKHLVVPNDDGTVAHAQLSFGNGMIMVGSAVDSEFGKLMKQPDEIGGFATQSPYVIVSDADVVYARAKLAGAVILIDIKDEDYGGRGFTCRDLEGHIWTFGTYDPWAPDSGRVAEGCTHVPVPAAPPGLRHATRPLCWLLFRRPGRGVDFGTRRTTIQCPHQSEPRRGGPMRYLCQELKPAMRRTR